MTQIAFDPNKQPDQNTTDVLASDQPSNTQNQSSTQDQMNPQAVSGSYISDGNPYGNYATPGQMGSQTQPSSSNQSSQQTQNQPTQGVRRQSNAPSSGLQTNVQEYIQKNQQGSQRLGEAVSGRLQTSADMAKQNLQGVQQNFGQSMEAGSLENFQGAVDEAKGAFEQAATMTAGSQRNTTNQAEMYTPDAEKDADLIASNKARVSFGDNTTKDFATQFEAQRAIDEYNRLNPETLKFGGERSLDVGQQRLADILNAQYKGPRELYEARGYGDAVNQFSDVQSLQDLALGSGSKGELLERTFQNPNTQYGMGNKLLDDLLLGQGSANQQLRETATNLAGQEGGKFTDVLQSSVRDARTQSQQRSEQLEDVKMSARAALTDVATGRDSEVRQRIEGVIENWDKYPQYFRDKFQGEMDKHQANIELRKNYDKVTNDLAEFTGANLPSGFTISRSKKERRAAERAATPMGRLNTYKQEMGVIDEELNAVKEQLEKLGKPRYFNSNNDKRQYQRTQNALSIKLNDLQSRKNQYQEMIAPLEQQYQQLLDTQAQYADFKNYDPETLNFNLSQLEAEALGVQGGEGLYNLIKERGIEGLLQTAKADEKQLISRDEQSQLARLQKLAELATDYGSADSGIDFRNQFTDRDLAGKQTALSALDTTGFRDALFGAEKNFQDRARGANITGAGTGYAQDRGVFGTKSRSSTRYLTENLGNLLDRADGFRKIYNPEDIDDTAYNNLAKSARGILDGSFSRASEQGIDPASLGTALGLDENLSRAILNPAFATGAVLDANKFINDKILDFGEDLTGSDTLSKVLFAPAAIGSFVSDIGGKIASAVGGGLFGSSAGLQSQADVFAQQNAAKDLQNKITNRLRSEGYANQLGVVQDAERDAELLRLLGLLDTTNL